MSLLSIQQLFKHRCEFFYFICLLNTIISTRTRRRLFLSSLSVPDVYYVSECFRINFIWIKQATITNGKIWLKLFRPPFNTLQAFRVKCSCSVKTPHHPPILLRSWWYAIMLFFFKCQLMQFIHTYIKFNFTELIVKCKQKKKRKLKHLRPAEISLNKKLREQRNKKMRFGAFNLLNSVSQSLSNRFLD